ncbi:MAG: hypothetical protein ABR608_12060 [Pseudonocardiaceae bacterium]
MATRLPNTSQQAAADAVVDRIDTGTTNATGRLRIYTGAQPADADDAASGTLLVEILLVNPAYGAANTSGTAALLSTPRSAAATAAGTAGWFRVLNRDNVGVFDGSIRATADADTGQELVLDNTNIASGQTVNVNSLSYTQPASE